MILGYLPSPARSVWHLGPFPVRAYALCILAGIVVAVLLTRRRWAARGGRVDDVVDVAVWAVPFGIVGGRLYHVITDPELYFGAGRDPVRALYIWDGGLGIWGAVALGALGAWIGCRSRGIRLSAYADALAPGLAVAQAIGRWGNYANQELYGRATTLPWAVRIDAENRPADSPQVATYHPTFLYECLWDLGVAGVVVWAERRFRLGGGRAFALYVAVYTVGRAWIEALRVDHANHILGLRLNDWTSLIISLAAVAYLWRGPRPARGVTSPGVPDEVLPPSPASETADEVDQPQEHPVTDDATRRTGRAGRQRDQVVDLADKYELYSSTGGCRRAKFGGPTRAVS